MNKYLLGFIFLLTIIGCKKDETIVAPKINYSKFLDQTGQTFQGELNGESFSWSFGWNQFQSISGFENGNGVCDSTDPVRVVLFGLISEGGGHTKFTLYSPKYNSSSESEYTNVFSVGKKKLGDFQTDFYLTITKNSKFYQTNSSSTSNEIEILKTEEFLDNLGKRLRVWFRIDAKLSSCYCENNNSTLKDGLMIAEFYGYRK